MKIFILCMMAIFLYAKPVVSPENWSWRGVDIMAYTIKTDPQAVKFIIDNKINYVRIHIFKKKVMEKFNLNGNQALDLNLKWAKEIYKKLDKAGIKSFITIADFPVSLTTCINKRKTVYWQNSVCINQIYSDVQKTVEYFKDTNLLGYEFLGEPVVVKHGKSLQPENWNQIFKNIIKITRKVDKNKWLFYSPGPWGLPIDYDKVVPFDDNKIIYNAHMYMPHSFTHQLIGKNKIRHAYPGRIGLTYWDKQKLESMLKPLIDFQEKYHKPVCISEFSAALWAEGANKYLSDLIEIFNEYNWGWFYFNIGSYFKGWDARYDAYIDQKGNKKYIYNGINSKRFQMLKVYLQVDKR